MKSNIINICINVIKRFHCNLEFIEKMQVYEFENVIVYVNIINNGPQSYIVNKSVFNMK